MSGRLLDSILGLTLTLQYMKKNFLLQFAETPTRGSIDHELVEYSNSLNLTVLKGTNIPAVTFSDQATETFTKAGGEGTDSDHDLQSGISRLSGTETNTYHAREGSDSDPRLKIIFEMIATQTVTETREETDTDR
jgi:hypothetical protein